MPKVRNERVRYLSADEHKRLFEALEKSEKKWLKPLVIIAMDTGLRLTNLCELRQKGVDLHAISKLLGHKDLRMTKRYAHLNVDSLRRAVSVLDEESGYILVTVEGDKEAKCSVTP